MADGSAGLPLILPLLLPLVITAQGGESSGLQTELKLVPEGKTWDTAQEYCRRHFTDLAALRNEREANDAFELCPPGEACWIGLRRKEPGGAAWAWPGGEEITFDRWETGQPDNQRQQEDCVVSRPDGWRDKPCDAKQPFICSEDNTILVKENKTWEEALHHCRTLRSRPGLDPDLRDPVYDLFVPSPNADTQYAKGVVRAQADLREAWIGVRFLAGQWLWLNGRETKTLTRRVGCPVDGKSCGALRGSKEARDCHERRHFLCSKKPPGAA